MMLCLQIAACSSQEYVNGDNDIPVCQDMDSETWEEDFLLQLGKEDEEEEEEVEDSMQSEPTLATKFESEEFQGCHFGAGRCTNLP